MPAYGTLNPPTSLIPGDLPLLLLNGTEVIGAANYKSDRFASGIQGGAQQQGTTFILTGCPNGTQVNIQAANQDVDALYETVWTMIPDATGNNAYTDIGYSKFYRAIIPALTAGDVPVLSASR